MSVEALVRMYRHEGGWRVEVREQTKHEPGHRAFAAVEAYDIDTALRMAVPYLASLSNPDPFASLVEQVQTMWESGQPTLRRSHTGDIEVE